MTAPKFKSAKMKKSKRVVKTLEEMQADATGPFKPMKPYTIKTAAAMGSDDPLVIGGVHYPVWCTPKIDGIRSVTRENGTPLAYSLKPIPNRHIRYVLETYGVNGTDGELHINGAKTFGESSGPIMRVEGTPDFTYYIFDRFDQQGGYISRTKSLDDLPLPRPPCIVLVKPVLVLDEAGFMAYWNKCVNDGFEGVIARKDWGYKHGRSTASSSGCGMGKYKQFQDDEAEIIGFEEMCTNTNPKTTNLHGRSERSSAKAGKVPNGHMGKWLCRDLKTGIEFDCGTMLGITMKQRKAFWDNRQIYMGWIIKYKHQPSGPTAKPRFPTFLGFRHKDDM